MDRMSTSLVFRYWGAPMFTFGAIRGYRAEMPEKENLLSNKLTNSFLNGIFYIIPPLGIVKLTHVMDRIEVDVTHKNPNSYAQIYWEGRGMNKNTFL